MATWPSTRVFRVSLGGHLAFAVHQAAASHQWWPGPVDVFFLWFQHVSPSNLWEDGHFRTCPCKCPQKQFTKLNVH